MPGWRTVSTNVDVFDLEAQRTLSLLGNVIVSVFYTEGNFLKEFTSTNNNWAWGGNIGSIQPNTEFASAVISNNGKLPIHSKHVRLAF